MLFAGPTASARLDPVAVAAFGPEDVDRLLGHPGIVGHRGKIEAAVTNAAAVHAAQQRHGSPAALVWSFEPRRRGRRVPVTMGDQVSATPESTALAREFTRLGFRLIGPAMVHAAMQSLCAVNDHRRGCHVRADCDAARRAASSQPRGGSGR